MPHTITGQIRKDVYMQAGSSAKGEWKMYAVELSESWKDKNGERQYTNYRATVFGSSPAAIGYYDQVIVKGACVSFSSETLQVNQREHNGNNYITMELVNPRLVFAQAPGQNQQASSQPQKTQHMQQAQRNRQFSGSQQQSRPQPQQNSAPVSDGVPMDFDDDIPFSFIGLQYANHAIHSL
ncbi:hypothetical protein [Leclercia sp.]|uniref:hypothetical protein n=1 Tax=Leclercia sp. TaxID=1898428 RepID=UPI0028A61206|nr:hypothetical protein [Leclercia sp.]